MHKYDSSISHNNFIKIATLGYTLSLHTRYRDTFHREAKDSLGLLDSICIPKLTNQNSFRF